MFLIDLSQPRIIGLIVGLSIAVVSLAAIIFKYFVHKHNLKKQNEENNV